MFFCHVRPTELISISTVRTNTINNMPRSLNFNAHKKSKKVFSWLKNEALLPICVEFVRAWGLLNRVWDLCNISNEESKHGTFSWYVYRVHTIDIYVYPILTEISKKMEEVKTRKFLVPIQNFHVTSKVQTDSRKKMLEFRFVQVKMHGVLANVGWILLL